MSALGRPVSAKCWTVAFIVVTLLPALGCDAFHHHATSRRVHCHGTVTKNHSSFDKSLIFVVPRGGGWTTDSVSSSTTAIAATRTNSPNDNSKPSLLLSKYYLIWSRTMITKMVISTAVLAVFYLLALPRIPQHRLLAFLERHNNNAFVQALLPLLASACCTLQLLFNLIWTASGCAGFNTALGPWRPYLLALLAYVTAVATPQRPWVLAGQWILALLPEMVHVINVYNHRRTNGSNKSISIKSISNNNQVVVQLNIPTMGCVACINKIDASLRQVQQVNQTVTIADFQSWLQEKGPKGGKAKVVLQVGDDNPPVDEMVGSLVQAVERAGFACTVDSVAPPPSGSS